MIDLNSILLIIKLNMNGQNTSIKRQKILEWREKQNSIMYHLQNSYLT